MAIDPTHQWVIGGDCEKCKLKGKCDTTRCKPYQKKHPEQGNFLKAVEALLNKK